jgi:ADP-heptose:LPS heptosyltransferase
MKLERRHKRNWPRILITRPDHLGDVLLTLPAAVALRFSIPDAHICFLVSNHLGDVTTHCPAIDETYTLPFPPVMAQYGARAWPGLVTHRTTIKRGCFDIAILARPDDPWSGELMMAAGIPVRIGYEHPRTLPFLTRALPFRENRHVTMHALDLIEAAMDYFTPRPSFPTCAPVTDCFAPTSEEEAAVVKVLTQAAPDAGMRPCVLHPGSSWPIKNWSPHQWGALAARLRQSEGFTPVVTGGKDDLELVSAVVQASKGQAYDLAGKLTIGSLAALFRRASLVIATDSGPLHLAAMVGARVVGLYGPADPLKFGPYCPPENRRIVRVQLPCSPCGEMLSPPCGVLSEPPCVAGITVNAILSAAAELHQT